MIGLRVGEATSVTVTDVRYEAGYEVLRVMGKGSRRADIPMPIPVLRAVQQATAGRTAGPILLSRSGERMSRNAAGRLLRTVARRAGVTSDVTPHALRRTFCTAGLIDLGRPAA